jgi:hypothetical protein
MLRRFTDLWRESQHCVSAPFAPQIGQLSHWG